MDRETLIAAIDQGPVRVYMNDGQSFKIEDHKACAVDSTTVYVMYRDETSDRIKTHWLSLVAMTRIESVSIAS